MSEDNVELEQLSGACAPKLDVTMDVRLELTKRANIFASCPTEYNRACLFEVCESFADAEPTEAELQEFKVHCRSIEVSRGIVVEEDDDANLADGGDGGGTGEADAGSGVAATGADEVKATNE